MSASSFQVGDYAETDRHYGRIIERFVWPQHVDHGPVVELRRLECLHGPQKRGCNPCERVFSSQLKPALSPEELVAQKLGEDYL